MRHVLTRVIFAHRIRIHPKKWNTVDAALRLEFGGCNFGERTYEIVIFVYIYIICKKHFFWHMTLFGLFPKPERIILVLYF